ncbi:MAG: aldo/keto reductase [Actinomycetota bacterium]
MIPRHGLGTAPLGGLFTEVTEEDAFATIQAALNEGIRYFDTAPLYGNGLAEARLGTALRASGIARERISLSTKVGRILVPGIDPDSTFRDGSVLRPQFDYSADGVRRSLDESLVRLQTDHIELVLVHDPDDHESDALGTAFPTLIRLRDEGVIGAIGVGMNQVAMLTRFAAKADDIGLDFVLAAGRWTLLDRSAGSVGGLLDTCKANNVRVIIGGVFNSGLLATPSAGGTFDYVAADGATVAIAQQMVAVCRDFNVALTAAALQFPWHHPASATVLVGARSAAEVQQNHIDAAAQIPDALWPALDACLTGSQ